MHLTESLRQGAFIENSSVRGVADTETINTDDTVTSVELKKKKKKAEGLKQTGRKKMHGQFARES